MISSPPFTSSFRCSPCIRTVCLIGILLLGVVSVSAEDSSAVIYTKGQTSEKVSTAIDSLSKRSVTVTNNGNDSPHHHHHLDEERRDSSSIMNMNMEESNSDSNEPQHGSLRTTRTSDSNTYKYSQKEDEDEIVIDDLQWPWHRDKKNKTDHSCSGHGNCTTCTAASNTCHWCNKDNQCHAKGSWYGCAVGNSCTSPSHNDTVDTSCKSHLDCTSCSISSKVCHWCAFDEQCHAVGSVYGCGHGVNCYSNDRCRRTEPEQIEEATFADIGIVPISIIVLAAMGVLCCSTVLYAGANALKGAFSEMAEIRAPPSEAFATHGFQTLTIDTIGEGLEGGEEDEFNENNISRNSNGDNDDNDNLSEAENIESRDNNNETCESNLVARDEDEDESGGDSTGNGSEARNGLEMSNSEDNERQELTTSRENQMTEKAALVTAHPDPSRLTSRMMRTDAGTGGSHWNCLLRSCKAWYFFTVVISLFLATSSIIFFPKVPDYNVCSDQFAWQSIISGLTSLKVEASFEILVSVENRNRLDIALEGVSGDFSYDGEQVGTFTVKRTLVQATSITDAVVTCTVTPTRWEALGLISDYYKGKLVLMANVSGIVRIRGIGITLPVKISDVLIPVNDQASKDRHLCACPEWKDVKPTISPLPFKAAIQEPVESLMAMNRIALPEHIELKVQ
eukprot:950019_1